MSEDQSGSASRTFAQRLDLLFRATHPAGRDEVGYQEVADAVASAGGPTVTANYLYLLRTGRRSNPRMDLVRALARYFNVPAGYFIDDEVAQNYTDQLELLQAIRDSGTAGLALRAASLSPEARAALTVLLDGMRAAEKPPRPDAGSPSGEDRPT
ncbi:XRE family transcriptional regulator [Modestobacter muralis]|uniref:XRE family transcriptional regulator n=1 Tax=Modestobacter muralis TaxID=1608614 RepID=A0A6P0F004_9ACTN|nr:XRE family transcriptional regulator [Modestobacter muralis]NEK96595.1 XRE family transcriptional regulator [Modestobacter muralis]NEN53514.1 XRE family transcriptional regulator [Modestobacter muralis]